MSLLASPLLGRVRQIVVARVGARLYFPNPHFCVCSGGEIGRHTGLKILCFRKGRAGSSPARSTKLLAIVKILRRCNFASATFVMM